jgi:uncharacterized membrane protein YdbT with pleckstrin-like domain
VPYPRRLLHDDEQVVLDMRPHPIRLFRPVAMTVVIGGGIGAAFFGWRSAPSWFGLVLGVVGFVTLVYLLAKVASWRATVLVLTSSRVIYRSGIVRRIGREIPIDRVQDVTYIQRLGERIVGAGSLIVESAGDRGTEPFPDIRRPEQVQSAINRAVDAAKRGEQGRPDDAPVGVGSQIEELADLHRQGVLTDAEFAEKKRELLDRL